MKIKNKKIKLLVIVLILFLCSLFINIRNSFGIYKSNLSTPINLTVLDPLANYVITFDLNDGSGTTSLVYRSYNQPIGTLPTPTRENYSFDGWYAAFENDVYSNPVTASTVVTGDMILYAKWLPNQTNTVTFDANGGTINGESTFDLIVNTGSMIDENDFPEAVYLDYSFDGWFTDSLLNEPFDETEPIIDNITLYAAWKTINQVARVNGIEYNTLDDAITAVPNSGVKTRVTILKDITLSETVTIPNTKWVELAGRNYTIDGNVSLITNNGTLDIISGTMNTATSKGSVSIVLNKSSSSILTVSGGNLTNNSTIIGDNSVIENTSGTVNITGGVLTGHAESAVINNKRSGTIEVSGGTIIGTNIVKGQAIYLDSGTVTISGDSYLENNSTDIPDNSNNNPRATVDNAGGTLIITGGTIVSNNYSAVIARKAGTTTRIGIDDDTIDISTPVLRGKRYGLERTVDGAVIKVYDGIFESLDQAQAISTTDVTKPTDIDFKTDGTVVVDGVTYHAAYLLAPSITINFYEESNGTAIPVVVDSGSSIGNNLPTPNPKQGYYFAGWYIDGNPLQPVTSETVVTRSFNAYAKWVQSVSNATMDTTMNIQINQSEKIEFEEDDIEDVTYSSSDTNVVTIDTDGTIHAVGIGTATITLTGDLSGDIRTLLVTVTKIMHTVTFKDGNNVIKEVEVEDGTSVGSENMPANQIKTNYIFNGWVYEDNNTLTPFTSATQVYGNIDVLVSWKEEINIATLPEDPLLILLDSNKEIVVSATGEGNLVEDYTLSSSNTNVVEVNGKIISGASVGSVTLTITGVESHKSETITVEVVNSYAVTFDPDNGESATVIRVEVGSSIDGSGGILPTDPIKSGSTFDNWYLYDSANETLATTPIDTTATVTGDITYKARWAGQDDVAVINTASGPVYYPSLAHALNGAPADTETEIRIIKDIPNSTCSKNVTPASCDSANDGRTMVPVNRNVVLNGGSHTVSCGSDTIKNLIYNRGTLRIISGTFSCGKSGLATLENNSGAHIYIDGGVIENTNDRSAIYNMGTVEISGGTLTSTASERGVVQNANNPSSITMTGGTVIQTVSSDLGALHNGKSGSSITITGGTVISAGNAIQNINGTTLVIGTQNDAYDVTSPVIQGDLYGVTSTVNYSVYDGIIKGKKESKAVNDFNKITGIESGFEIVTGKDGDYYTLYYEVSNLIYHIDFDAGDGIVSPTYLEYNVNTTIDGSNFPTPTRENYTFDGWYTDSTLQTPFVEFTPATPATVTYYAKWAFNS